MSDTQELRAIANELIDVLERHAETDPTVRLQAAQFATTTFQQLHNIPLGALLNIPTGTQSNVGSRKMSATDWLDLQFLDSPGRWVIEQIEVIGSLAMATSAASLAGALIAVWTMQRTTALATWRTRAGRMLWLQRLVLAGVAISLAFNTITPFITPDPPWLAMLPLILAVSLALLIFGMRYQPINGR